MKCEFSALAVAWHLQNVCAMQLVRQTLCLMSREWQDDGEPYVLSSENVRGCDVYVVQSLFSDLTESVSDKFLKLLLFARSLRDASANRITLVLPYLAFQRQDRKTQSRAPVFTKIHSRDY
jgi:phosphoribosylpyrophosphate synthetase